MPTLVIQDNNLWDLEREVIVDIGSGQPAILVTTVAPTPSSLVVGAFESLFVNDVVSGISQYTFTLNPYGEDNVIAITEDITMLLQDYSPLVSELEYVSENVSVFLPHPSSVQNMFDAVSVVEVVTVFSEGANPPGVNEAVTTSESVTTDPVPNPGTFDAVTNVEATTVTVA